MPDHLPMHFMHLTYVVVGAIFLAAVSAALVWLFLATFRRRLTSSTLGRQEFVWTLVPALIVVGLTILGEIPHGWVTFAPAPRADATQSRGIH